VIAIASSGTRDVVICALPAPPPISYPNQAYIFSKGTFSPVPGAFNVKAVAVEDTHVLAVTRDGRVMASGFPETWLADGIVEGLTNVVSVGLNYTGGAALTADGRVIELGRLSVEQPALTNVIALDVAGQSGDDDLDYKLAVTSDGRVLAWGLYESGYPPSAEIPGVVTAAGGWNHVVALKSDGTVVQWDLDNAPTAVAGLSSVVAVAAGGEHSVALKADGTVVAWGENYFGQLNVPPGLSNVVAIAASEYQSVALKSDGTLTAWGHGYTGEDVTPPANLSNVVAIASGGTRNVAIGALPAPLGAANQPFITNPSFEIDAVPPHPGYGSITGWTPGGGLIDGYGINESNGAFADNGSIPHGTRIGFIQDNGTLSQRVSGFTLGAPYWLAYRENARGLCCGERTATLSVLVDGTTVVADHVLAIAGEMNPYRLVTSEKFTASATDMTITFVKGGTGDSTALIDDVRIFTTNSLRLAIAFQEGNVPVIHIEGIPGRMVTLEYNDSLMPEGWQDLTSFLLTTESAVVADSPMSPSHPRFYRAHQTP
jgi:hypothetical protein